MVEPEVGIWVRAEVFLLTRASPKTKPWNLDGNADQGGFVESTRILSLARNLEDAFFYSVGVLLTLTQLTPL